MGDRALLLALGWVLTAWQRTAQPALEETLLLVPETVILFQGVPPLPLTPFPSPDVGPTTHRERLDPV